MEKTTVDRVLVYDDMVIHIYYTTKASVRRHRLTLLLSAFMVVISTACSNGIDGEESSTKSNIAIIGASRPSLSAAQLSGDSTITVQTAIAQSIDSLDPGPLVISAANSTSTSESSPENANTDNLTPDETIAQSTIDSVANTTTVTRDNTVPTESENTVTTEAETHFVSVTTPGFEGEILEDAIRISWPEDPAARGYNVYRQADYYITVSSAEFTDTQVYDDDYYYEIQAYDDNDNFWYIATGLTVSARSFNRTDPSAQQPKDDLLQDYALVFSDEFNNTELDLSKWNTGFIWGTDVIINNEEQFYVDVANDPDFGFNPFSFDGNHLTISTIETPAELSAKSEYQPYLSGLITSYDAFKFTYGYVETRAKLTHGRGYWPAFWLLNAYYVDAKPEIDIMEFVGHNQDVIYHTYHYFDSAGELRSTDSHPVVGIDFTEDFHTFGVEWMPGSLVFYVDGIETHRVIDINVSQQEMYVIANQAVGGWWAGSPDETTPLPGKYVIDYIRVYQRTRAYEIIEFDQSTDIIPLFTEDRGNVIPNKRPPFRLWPEGYPDRQ